jgi:small subunit ribosomal protein S6
MLAKKVSPARTYEITYLVGSGYTTAETASLQDSITALVGKNDGKIVEVNDWGKKQLAYPIRHEGKNHTEANYTHLVVEMPAKAADEVAHALKLKKEVIRSLVVVR